MRNYNLFLDDVRMPVDCFPYMHNSDYLNLPWVIVRSHAEFVKEIEDRFDKGEFPALVSFDHDLADEHYDPSMYHGVQKYEEAYVRFEAPTGRSSAEFLVQFCIDKDITMPPCLIHSMNPAGKERIKQTLLDYERFIERFK
jgi:hypothetical protein